MQRSKSVAEYVDLMRKTNNDLGRVLDGTNLCHFSFLEWLKSELKHRAITLLFPSLRIKHVPVLKYIRLKIGLDSKDEFLG